MIQIILNSFFRKFARQCDYFWTCHLALLYGICFYLGCVVALSPHPTCLIPFLFLLFPCFILKMNRLRLRLGLAVVCGVVCFWYTSCVVQFPSGPIEKVPGVAVVEISDISPVMHYGRPSYKISLNLITFESDSGKVFAKNIPCKWICNDLSRRPLGGFCYSVRAMLNEREGIYSLKIAPEAEWNRLKTVFSLVEWRFRAKAYFKQMMAANLVPSQAREFLEGVLIGEFHDQLLTSQLKRFGLQHILVASGFHFTLITTLFALILRLVLPWKATIIALLFVTTVYLLFIGTTPSVLRAWCSTSVLLFSKLLEEKGNGLNCLGIGLIVVLLIDPTFAISLSFQLSFIATLAILLFYSVFYRAIKALFPSRTGSEVIAFPFFEQVTLVLLSFFCSSIALVLAVSLFVLPMSLFAFQSFPLMGILYNCFFPFIISAAICILCVGLLISWISPIAAIFFSIASFLTETALTLVTCAPSWLDMTIYCGNFSATILVFYLSLLIAISFFITTPDLDGQT